MLNYSCIYYLVLSKYCLVILTIANGKAKIVKIKFRRFSKFFLKLDAGTTSHTTASAE